MFMRRLPKNVFRIRRGILTMLKWGFKVIN